MGLLSFAEDLTPAGLATKLFKYAALAAGVIIILGSVYLYVHTTTNTIAHLNQQVATLNIQAKELQAANDKIIADMQMVQAAQQQAQLQINGIRVQSNVNAAKIRNSLSTTTDPKALTDQVNNQTKDMFNNLMELTK